MAVNKKKKKGEDTKALMKSDILKPFNLSDIGSDRDPCFGKHYNLSTKECKLCGDSELCCISFAQLQGKTRKELETENNYKDLDTLVDKSALKKYYRKLVRDGEDKKSVLDKFQSKYELTRQEARHFYREFSKS